MFKFRARRRLLAIIAAAAAVATSVLVVSFASADAAEWPVVKDTHRGSNVKTVQHLLNQGGSGVEADGVFGAKTKSAVTKFQEGNDLDADGVVGAKTWPALTVDLKDGSTGDAVKALQVQLKRLGHEVPEDGKLTGATADALKAFKAENELPEDANVDDEGWLALVTARAKVGDYVLPLPQDAASRDKWEGPHHDYSALDVAVPTGTEAYAITSGEVEVYTSESCGHGAQVTSADGVAFRYCHFSEHAISNGPVEAGQKIGLTGSTGHSTGPHLHLQIKIGDTAYCPQSLVLALYDGDTPPAPADLPTSGCSY